MTAENPVDPPADIVMNQSMQRDRSAQSWLARGIGCAQTQDFQRAIALNSRLAELYFNRTATAIILNQLAAAVHDYWATANLSLSTIRGRSPFSRLLTPIDIEVWRSLPWAI